MAAANNGSNKLEPEDRAAHDWYRFVLSFPPLISKTTAHAPFLTE